MEHCFVSKTLSQCPMGVSGLSNCKSTNFQGSHLAKEPITSINSCVCKNFCENAKVHSDRELSRVCIRFALSRKFNMKRRLNCL